MNKEQKQEKSMQEIFKLMIKHSHEYPDDLVTMYVGRVIESEYGHSLLGTLFKDNMEEHFLKSNVYSLCHLMRELNPEAVKYIYHSALELYNSTK